jgi:hypothetical protein
MRNWTHSTSCRYTFAKFFSSLLEDSVTAEIVPSDQHVMAFGTLAAVNAVG